MSGLPSDTLHLPISVPGVIGLWSAHLPCQLGQQSQLDFRTVLTAYYSVTNTFCMYFILVPIHWAFCNDKKVTVVDNAVKLNNKYPISDRTFFSLDKNQNG